MAAHPQMLVLARGGGSPSAPTWSTEPTTPIVPANGDECLSQIPPSTRPSRFRWSTDGLPAIDSLPHGFYRPGVDRGRRKSRHGSGARRRGGAASLHWAVWNDRESCTLFGGISRSIHVMSKTSSSLERQIWRKRVVAQAPRDRPQLDARTVRSWRCNYGGPPNASTTGKNSPTSQE